MTDVKSVSKPQELSGLEFEAAPDNATSAATEGARGNADETVSRAVRAFVRTGKSEQPLRPTPGPGIPGLETVIGDDERVRIVDTDLLPWRMICALRLKGPTGSAVGTGWLAGPKTILTAGHCVHHLPFFGGWVQSIDVSAGRDAARFPFGTIKASRFSALDKWVESRGPRFRHRLHPSRRASGRQDGVLRLRHDDARGTGNAHGEHQRLPGGSQQRGAAVLSLQPCLERRSAPGFLRRGYLRRAVGLACLGAGGSDADPVVIGVHAYGTGGTPFNLGITANSAPRFIPEVFDIISGWVAEDNGDGDGGAAG